MNNRGVTLVELLITIVVMGIISTFSTVAVNEIVDNVRQGGFVENGETFLAAAKQAYLLGSDMWDDDQATLQELVDYEFIESISNDPWGKPYKMDETIFTIEEVNAATEGSTYISSITLSSNLFYSGKNIVFEGVVISETATMGLREEGPLREFHKSDIDFTDGSTNLIQEAIDSVLDNSDDELDTDPVENEDTNNDTENNDTTNNDNSDNNQNTESDNNSDDETDTNEDNEDSGSLLDSILDGIFGDDEETEEDDEETDYTTGNDTKTINDKVTSSSSIYALDGNDTITINNKVDTATIDLGSGNDKLYINNEVKKANIVTGDGNDTVDIDADVKDGTTINTGAGNDTVNIDEINNGAYLATGDGNDNVYIRDISKNFKSSITLGDGNDYFRTDESAFKNFKGTIDGGEGNDTLYLLNVTSKDWYKTVYKYFTGFERVELKDTTINN